MKLTIALLVATCSLIFSQNALIEIEFICTDGVGGSRVLTAGLDPSATDGVDESLGELELPPPPQGFYSRFRLPSSLIQTWKDIRQGDETPSSIGNKTHTVNYQLGAGSAGLTINWNLPVGIELNIQDPFGGILINQDFSSGPNNYTITFLALTSFIMTIKYLEPPFPVELLSFNGRLIGENISLSWETATETNNYGFEVERNDDGSVWANIGFVLGNGNSNSTKHYSFLDDKINGGNKISYRLKQIDNDGSFEYSQIVEVSVIVNNYKLYQNYPNPFNPSTTIRFGLPKDQQVKMIVYDILGKEVVRLINNEQLGSGYHTVEWNATIYTSGVYILKIEAGNFSSFKRMMLLK